MSVHAPFIAGNKDTPSASGAPLVGSASGSASGRDVSESLRLSKKQRQMAEAWLQASTPGAAHTVPVLLPGPLLPAEGELSGADAAPAPAPGGGRGRGRKSK